MEISTGGITATMLRITIDLIIIIYLDKILIHEEILIQIFIQIRIITDQI